MNIVKNILKKSENKFGDNKKVSNFATPFEMMGKTKIKFFENIEEGKKRVNISCQ